MNHVLSMGRTAQAARAPTFRRDVAAVASDDRMDRPESLFLERALALVGQEYGPCLLFVPCGGSNSAAVAGDVLAVSAAWRLGRTLRMTVARLPLTGQGLEEPVIPQATQDAAIPNLFHNVWPESLLHTTDTGQPIPTLLEATSRAYRLVVIDCAATSVSAQALTLAPLCGGTVVVVEAGVTSKTDIESTVRDLTAAGARVRGTVLMADSGRRRAA